MCGTASSRRPWLTRRPSERVVRELVRGIELHEDAKLGLRLLPAADPEIRDPERLADGTRRGLGALRLFQRDGRLRRTAAPEVGPTPLEQVVRLAHEPPAVRTERSDTRPRTRAQTESSLRAARMRRRASCRARDASVAPASGARSAHALPRSRTAARPGRAPRIRRAATWPTSRSAGRLHPGREGSPRARAGSPSRAVSDRERGSAHAAPQPCRGRE